MNFHPFHPQFKKKPLSKTLVGCGPIKGDEVELGSAFKSARIGDDSTVVGRQPVHLPTVQLVDTGKATQIGQVCQHTAPPGSDYHTNPYHTKLHHIILSYQNKPPHLTRFPYKPPSISARVVHVMCLNYCEHVSSSGIH